jgi:hypothetical protein
MKRVIVILALAGCMVPRCVAAQAAGGCAACVGAAACDTKQASCVQQCRARYFNVDPRRSDCIAHCEAVSSQCTQVAGSACRTQNSCR